MKKLILLAFLMLSVFMPRKAFADTIKSVLDKGQFLQLVNYQGAVVASKIEVSKVQIKLKKIGNIVYLYDNSISDKYAVASEPVYYKLIYSQITTPSTPSSDSLLNIINTYINTGSGSGSVSITGTVPVSNSYLGNLTLLNNLPNMFTNDLAFYNQNNTNLTGIYTQLDLVLEKQGLYREKQGVTSAITTTTDTDLLTACSSGQYTMITSLTVTNSHSTVGTVVQLIDDSDNATFHIGYAASGGGGYTASFPVPLRLKTPATKVQVRCGTTGANVYVSASGYCATN